MKNSKNIALTFAFFAVLAVAIPVFVSTDLQVETKVVSAWAGGTDDGQGGCCGGGPGEADSSDRGGDPDPVLPTCDFLTANPSTIRKGDSSLLKWGTTNATKVSIRRDNGSNLQVPADGSMTVSPDKTAIFTLTAEGTDGSDTCATKVTVTTPTPAPSCDSFNATPSIINKGDSARLDWATTNATKVELVRPFGTQTVAADGSQVVTPSIDYTFRLKVYGTDNQVVTCDAPVKVITHTPELKCDLSVTDSHIDEGETTKLVWSTTGATSVRLDEGIGSVSLDGSRTVSPDNDVTYTLTAKNDYDTVTCDVHVEVDEDNGGGSSRSPRCDLDISDSRIYAGEEVTLEWDTRYTDEIILEDSDGNILIESDDRDDLDGEITIRPTHDLTFTLTAIDGRRDDECEVEVEVLGRVGVTEYRNQPPRVAGVTLTQVPYTGFEAGPMMTLFFYVLLTIWGLFVAYVVALRKGIIDEFSFAGATFSGTTSESVQTNTGGDTAVSASHKVADAPSNLPTGTLVPTPVIGYENKAVAQMEETEADDSLNELENLAHEHKALFSSDAMRYFAEAVPADEQATELVNVVKAAKGTFPNEDGWVVINLNRLETLLESEADQSVVTTDTVAAPTTAGSLAEAIVTGNVVAAYQMIAHRPMIALADAAAELDALLRVRSGSGETVSDLLEVETANLSEEQLRNAIHALTGALDGTYTSETEAVKMAIMKAVKAVS